MTDSSAVTLTLDQALQFAIQHHQAGRFSDAEALYRQILEVAPETADAWHLLGALCLQFGKPEQALQLIDQAIALATPSSRNLADFYANRGEALRSLGQPAEAIAALSQAIKLHPEHVPAHNNLGIVLRDLGRTGEAVNVLERAVALRPEHIQAQNNLALAYRTLGRHEEALEAFGRALTVNPNLAEAHHNRADLLREQGKLQEALQGYHQALSLKNDFSAAFYGYFTTLLQVLQSQPGGEESSRSICEPNSDTPEFSVIVCSHRPEKYAAVRHTFARAMAGSDWELILIDDACSLAEAYNRAVASSRGRYLVFSHDDIEILSPSLADTLRLQLNEADLLGIAGTDRVLGAHWQEAGWPHLHGLVTRPLPPSEGDGVDVCIFGTSAELISDIQSIDGCFFAARRQLFDQLQFDAETFDGFHLYDIDLSYAAHLAGLRVAVSSEIVVAHDSPGNYDAEWSEYAARFAAKYRNHLPSGQAKPRYFLHATLPTLHTAYSFARSVADLSVPNTTMSPQADGSYEQWIERYESDCRDAEGLAAAVAALPLQPLISVLMPVYNPDTAWLAQAINSLLAQAYTNWELCAVNDASPNPEVGRMLDAYAALDPRIRISHRSVNGHICAASNDALAMCNGEFVALLDHDDELSPHALYWLARTINEQPEVTLIYSDEDKLGDDGRRRDPYFKPDWNPDLLRSQNYLAHLIAYRRQALLAAGGFRDSFEGAQDYDLALRISEVVGAAGIAHIPRILYHWRIHEGSTASGHTAKPYALLAGERAIDEHLERIGVRGKTSSVLSGYRVRYALPEMPPLVTIIMPTRDGKFLRAAVDSLYAHTAYRNWNLLIVDNGSEQPDTLRYLAELEASGRARILHDTRPFNFSALNNAAANIANGELFLFLNDDVEATNDDWLSELVSHAVRPEIGAVGARLWYPDGRLQHGGVILVGGVGGHAHKRLKPEASGYFGRARLIQNFSAVTAACLLLSAEKFRSVGGYDEQLTVAFNDVDLCLRLQQTGYRNLWSPYAELVHHESVSRGHETTPAARARFAAEVSFMQSRWGQLLRQDPAYNPNLSFTREDFSLAWPPRLPEFERGDGG